MTRKEAATLQAGDRVRSRGRTGTVYLSHDNGYGQCIGVRWDGVITPSYLGCSWYNLNSDFGGELRRLHKVTI
jgi:hypothetical protein